MAFKIYSWLVSFTAGLGGFLFGYEIGIINQVFTMVPFQLFFGLSKLDENGVAHEDAAVAADISGWVTFTFLIGAAAGAAIVSYPCTWIGRKFTIMLGGAFFMVGVALQTGANGVGALYAGRVVGGAGVGFMSASVPLYISETADTAVRGRLIAIYQFMITIGIFIATCVNSVIIVYFGAEKGDAEWRLAFGLQFVPCALMLVALLFLPFSPRWLCTRDRNDEALKIIARLRDLSTDDVAVRTEYQNIVDEVQLERAAGEATWLQLFVNRDVRYRTFLGITLQFFQQWTGINIILYFGSSLFAALGFSTTMSNIGFPLINAAVNMVATIPGMWLVERKGRKWLLVIGGFGMAVSLILVLVFGQVGSSNGTLDRLGAGSICFILVFVIFFGATWGPVVWVYQSEIFPLAYRAKGTSASTVSNWAWNAIVSKVAPLMLASINYYTYLVFGGFCIAMALFTIFAVPETRGLTLEQIDTLFGVDHKKVELSDVKLSTAPGATASGTDSLANSSTDLLASARAQQQV